MKTNKGDIHEGGCLCGAVRYRAVAGDTMTVTHCHCRMCRRASGGSFITWVEFPTEGFVITKGQPSHFRSSDLSERAFCGDCGCQLSFWDVGDPDGFAADIWVALGAMDQPADIQPTHHIFTDEQMPQLHFDDDLPRWPEQLPWLLLDDELPQPTVPNENEDDQRSAPVIGDNVHEGGCICGATRYRAIVDNGDVVLHCHCGMCRKSSGATLVSWVQVPAKGFTFTKDQPKYFRSSPMGERTFCGTCGCQFTFQTIDGAEKDLENLWLTLGSTDRPEDFGPAQEFFTEDRIPWLRLI